jgi:hypothetical protein
MLLIILFTIIGYLLLMLPPAIGGVIAFGILMGCLYRGFYFLRDIHKRISKALPTERENELKLFMNEIKRKKL